MDNCIIRFADLKDDLRYFAGGKGSALARMYQSGLPVPEGFVVLPGAFENNLLNKKAWNEIQNNLGRIRDKNKNALFAVRSSALHEDSSTASFAGEYETVLDVKTDDDILKAVYTVYQSRQSERVKVYSEFQKIEHAGEMAIVIQLMAPCEISGVLFTVDPITGSHSKMTGNFVYGMGEQLVSGAADANSFSFTLPEGNYKGPKEFKKYSAKLFKYAVRLETDFNQPQDIEWAASRGKLYLLQTRPVTNIKPGNPETYEWNDSVDGDYIWINTNLAEAVPDVMTPLTFSMMRYLDIEQNVIPGWYLCSGNICGRIYTNISLLLSFMAFLGINVRKGAQLMRNVFGDIPPQMTIPVHPFRLSVLFKTIVPRLRETNKRNKIIAGNIPEHLKQTPGWCVTVTENIKNTKTLQDLAALWTNNLKPYLLKSWFIMIKDGDKRSLIIPLSRKLIKLTGTGEFCDLLYKMGPDSGMASLDLILGIAKIIKGELSRGQFLNLYGHQRPNPGALSVSDTAEENDWLDKMIMDFKNSGINMENLFKQKFIRQEELWKRFKEQYLHKIKWLKKQIDRVSFYTLKREATRSEYTRVAQVFHVFVLKAGELSGVGGDVNFLYLDEMINLLSGQKDALKHIPARKATYEKYKALPPLPSIIRGKFDPYQWVKDPDRRIDYFDNSIPFIKADEKFLKGFAGASGRVKGVVRVLSNPDEGSLLQPGEIIVAGTTNIGWSPLFPRAAAIITDIGAPLSHAAIVARELGIPAVVGCGNATSLLKSGDTVIVDGGQGIVQILD